MKPAERRAVDASLARKTLSHADFRRVGGLGDEGVEYLKGVLSAAEAPRQARVNGLRLLVRAAHPVSKIRGSHRLAEVFDVAGQLLEDADSEVRAVATRIVVGVIGLLKSMGQSVEGLGGPARVRAVLERAIARSPASVEGGLAENVLASLSNPALPR